MSVIKIITADSSNIASYSYDSELSVLTVEYKDKTGNVTATWEYIKVPRLVFDDAQKADSIGAFIRARVQGYYDGRKLNS